MLFLIYSLQPLNVGVSYDSNSPVTVALLDCDTITQAKEKILDVLFKVWNAFWSLDA